MIPKMTSGPRHGRPCLKNMSLVHIGLFLMTKSSSISGTTGTSFLISSPSFGGFFKNYSRRPTAGDLTSHFQDFKQVLPAVKRRNRLAWKQDPSILISDNFNAVLMLHVVSCAYLLVADKVAFETDQFLLVYLDSKLNTVMQGRIDINGVRLSQALVDWEMAELPAEVFEEGTLGEKYLYSGEIGRELYQWTREDLEDNPPSEET